MFFGHLPGGARDAGESYGQVGTEPKDRVVGARGVNRLDGKARPRRELRSDQAVHQRRVDGHLVGVHRAGGHEYLLDLNRSGIRRPVGGLSPGSYLFFPS